MVTATECWADPLSLTERYEVARLLARACKRFWDAADPARIEVPTDSPPAAGDLADALVQASREMSDLHLDATERAQVAPRIRS